MSATGKERSTRGVALDGPLALEVADAAAEQDHLRDRQLAPLGGRWLALGVFLILGGRPPCRDEDRGRDHDHPAQRGEHPLATHDALPLR